MYSRSSLRSGNKALRCLQCGQKRGLAAPASGSFAYQTGDAAGTKFASRDLSGPTTTLALVAKAGTRFQTLPGLTEGLQNFAFRNTEKRSALRVVRETELLGGELSAYHSRENLVIGAKFLRDDLPYFVELLSEVASQTKYQSHVYTEDIVPLIKLSQKKFLASTKAMALSSAHALAFHRGLGTPLYPSSSNAVSKYLNAETIEEYAQNAYSKSNFAIVANGAEHSEVTKWVGEFFKDFSTSGSGLSGEQSKYYGGEERIAHASGNTMVLAFSGSTSHTGSSYKPEIQVLASLLGGQSSIKWSPGFSLLSKAGASFPGATIDTKSVIYSDAGLLSVTIDGSAKDVASAAAEAVKTIKAIAGGSIAKEDIKKAIANAKFAELESGQNINTGIELTGAGLVHGGKAYQLDETAKEIDGVTEEKVKQAAKTLLEHKASISAVGDLYILPYATELGLNV
ncbi:LuxS/MPP-like metallohydrolase [Tothia fuscella]|uniref:Cytochrome b-c1 complex subunit 2, mitochondrial n=1 Tax=Tothia fuscella TaxID=1048955 RepID=A0A9P4NVY1_9PEZI|nr:LuxS/MPP-like metallohydrolase [Tothia fuscella]